MQLFVNQCVMMGVFANFTRIALHRLPLQPWCLLAVQELLSADAFVHLGGGTLGLLSGNRISETKMYNLVPDCKSVIGNCTTWWWYRSIRGNRCCLGGLLSHQYLSVHLQTGLVPRFPCLRTCLHRSLASPPWQCGIVSWWHGGMVAWQHGGLVAWGHHSGHSKIGHSHWSVMPT